MKEFGPKLDQKVKELMVEKKVFMKKLPYNTEDNLPLKESPKFLSLIININLVLQTDNKLYPQIYLDECFYEL